MDAPNKLVGWTRQHRLLTLLGTGLLLVLLLWLVQLLQVYQSVGQAQEYWAEPRGEEGGLVYVALGDSAAQGVGASEPAAGYVGQIAQLLRATTNRPVLVHNLSVSGATVTDVVNEQIPQLQDLDADVVTVAVGGNDIRGYDKETFTHDISLLMRELPAGTFVADVPYFMHGRWETDSAQAASIIRATAQKEGLIVVPLNKRLRAEGLGAMLTQSAADLFHPNDRGYDVWTEAFWNTIIEAGRGTLIADADNRVDAATSDLGPADVTMST